MINRKKQLCCLLIARSLLAIFLGFSKEKKQKIANPRGDFVEITIINWFKHNTRKDVKNPSWFKLNYRMLEDPDFDSLSSDEFKAWVYLLGCACRKQSDTFIVNFDHAKRVSNIRKDSIIKCVDKLARHGHVTRTVRERYANGTLEENRIEEKREESREAGFDFESLYLEFPRKEGKSRGLKICRAQIKTQADYESLRRAIQNYAKAKAGIELRYVKLFSTFMGEWKDWIEPPPAAARPKEYKILPDGELDRWGNICEK